MKLTERIGAQFRQPTGFGGAFSTFLMNTMNRRQYYATERELALSGGERVLDVGFGNGFMLRRLTKRHKCDYYGIEISADMVTAANKRNAEIIADGRMKLAMGDIVKTDFADSFFDKVYTVNTVYFWSDLSAGLAEINRIISNGGVFINTVYSKEWLGKLAYTRVGFAKYGIDELVQTGEQCGFSVRATSIVKGKSYCLVYKKTG
jgi:SAM-dependent methyltransferase